MNQNVTIVMYHYVRDLHRTRYPAIKGRTISEFRRQISYLKSSYTIITMENLVSALKGRETLPENAALLSFDDGYLEHYTKVFPILDSEKIQGSFFPPVATVERRELLNVNRIHFLLAVADATTLAKDLDARVDDFRSSRNLCSPKEYRQKWEVPNRFDDGETIYVKRMLQHVLPDDLRISIGKQLFKLFVGVEESVFADELYMNLDQLKIMQKNGMYVGSHGDSHHWLNTLTRERVESEVRSGLEFLQKVGSPVDDFWVMCYPYGAYNDQVLEVLDDYDCAGGLTTQVGVADLCHSTRLELPRLDTNDPPHVS